MKLSVISVGTFQRVCIQKLAVSSVTSFHTSSFSYDEKDGKAEEKASQPAERVKKELKTPPRSASAKKEEPKERENRNKKGEMKKPDEKKAEVKLPPVDKKKLEEAQKRLQALLKGFAGEQQTQRQVEIPRPKEKKQKKKRIQVVSELEAAASGVAEAMGAHGDKENVKTELMARVKAAEDGLPAYNKEELLQAITGLKDRIRLEEENKQKEKDAKKQKELAEAAEVASKTQKKESDWQSAFKKRELKRPQPLAPRVSLFDAEPLGIFTGKDGAPLVPPSSSLQSGLTTWSSALERELKLLVSRPPGNGFEEMIQWTEQGKLWKFPIDNEYGLDEEHAVGFHEHIFLEHHLEPWCPKSGPVRHFMELVCVGLSKNPWLTVQEKKRHIVWFKDYFAEKVELLKETNAIDESSAQKLLKPLEVAQ